MCSWLVTMPARNIIFRMADFVWIRFLLMSENRVCILHTAISSLSYFHVVFQSLSLSVFCCPLLSSYYVCCVRWSGFPFCGLFKYHSTWMIFYFVFGGKKRNTSFNIFLFPLVSFWYPLIKFHIIITLTFFFSFVSSFIYRYLFERVFVYLSLDSIVMHFFWA